MTDLVDTFERSAADAGCDVRRTATDRLDATLADLVEPPAVGAPLPFDGASLPDAVGTDPTPEALSNATTGVTPARFGIADYGSVGIAADGAGTEPASLYPDHHVAVLAAGDVVPDMSAGVDRVGAVARAGGDVVLATGPSATADMGELVVGAHGPRATSVVVLEDR